MADTLVIIPTYNEKENIEKFIGEIFKHAPDVNLLIADDNSPDGTGEIADRIAAKDSRVSIIHRLSNRGRGLAGVEAFKEAIKREGINYIIEMDADFSHGPKYIPLFLEEIKNSDIVIGSRYVEGGRDSERGYIRVILSKLVNLFIRRYLGLDINDCSSGYRCFRKEVLVSLDLDRMISKEPSIIEEVLYECKLKKYNIKEIPIIFKDRESGKTKLGIIKLVKVLMDIIKFKGIKNNTSRLRSKYNDANIVRATLDINLSSEALLKEEGVKGSRELRRFGFNLALGLTVAGFIMFLRHKPYFLWFLSAGAFVFILSILYPSALKPIKKILDFVIFSFSWLVNAISLLFAFYFIFTPIGILLRFFRKDLLHRKIDRNIKSYWLKRKNTVFSKVFYERMG